MRSAKTALGLAAAILPITAAPAAADVFPVGDWTLNTVSSREGDTTGVTPSRCPKSIGR